VDVGVPSGTVTFLFTDMEGSTRRWEEDPDAMRLAVVRHNECVRGAIEANGGYVFATGGDGFAAAFSRAADAVAAAQAAQAGLAEVTNIAVRMGINTGEVHERDGDYFGPPVNRTARLMAAGHGGQVLISGVTAELVPGLVLRNLGEHRLRDLGSPVLIWQLGSGEFPPLRTLDELPGNLPVQRTSFVGRADEVKALAALIGSERLVTLTGPGGVGKSRLALQVAAEVTPDFRDGAWFVGLTSLEECALVAPTILGALGVLERLGEPVLDTLCAWARTRQALVVIDNCEHLLTEVAEVVDRVLEASGTLSVVATSQSPLGVRGEHVWTVAPLSGPEGLPSDSVELFVDRAGMVRAEFTLNDDNEAAVVEICRRLDHIPLAIELAAARVRGMTPTDISRRLDQRFRLLASSDRSAPGRHRTLDGAMRWSYELLDSTQQRVFDRSSVFAGPFTIDAAEAVVAGEGVDEWEVLDGILALVDKSLVLVDEATGTTRYYLLETMRQFGQANLWAAGITERYRDCHADYYSDYVLSRRARLHGSGDQAALDEVETELENIRVALRQAADDHTSSRFEELYSALYLLWLGRKPSEGTSWALELKGRVRYLADHIGGAKFVEVTGGDLFVAFLPSAMEEIIEFLTGERPAVEVDRILTTLLFTDVVGSTERAASLGDRAWRSLLDSHDRTVRDHLRRFRGKEINTTGDGVLASFDGPARAIRYALAIAEATKALGIDLHLGLHTGECEVRGDDLGGLIVHIAARIGALAAQGEVLVSGTVKDLVAGSRIAFVDRGEHQRKGVPGSWKVYRAVA
jgi:predicted ATPase/class 3 adenylate cyclase